MTYKTAIAYVTGFAGDLVARGNAAAGDNQINFPVPTPPPTLPLPTTTFYLQQCASPLPTRITIRENKQTQPTPLQVVRDVIILCYTWHPRRPVANAVGPSTHPRHARIGDDAMSGWRPHRGKIVTCTVIWGQRFSKMYPTMSWG